MRRWFQKTKFTMSNYLLKGGTPLGLIILNDYAILYLKSTPPSFNG